MNEDNMNILDRTMELYDIIDLYVLYEELCPKKHNGNYVLLFREFISMVLTIDDLYTYFDHVLHLQHVSILRNLRMWVVYLYYKKVKKRGQNNECKMV